MDKSFISSLANPILGVVGGVVNAIGAGQQRKFEAAEAQKQRDWNERMQDKANAWNLEMWNKTNEYNSPIEQIQRLRDAGLNPLYYGLDGSSANAMQSAQALGYDRASATAFDNPLAAGFEGAMSAISLKKDIQLKNAQIDKLKEDTQGVGLDNEFKEKTLGARVEAENLANNLTKETIEKVKSEKRQVEENIKKTIEETKSEVERQGLIAAQTAVQKATEKQIVELLPYQRNLMEAQTEAQKAAAAASFAHALYERKLLESGYIDKMNEEMSERIKLIKNQGEKESAIAAREAWNTAVKTGELLSSDNKFVQGVYDVVLNYPLKTLSVIGSTLNDFSGLVLGAAAAGAGSKIANGMKNSSKVTNIYDANGNPMSNTTYSY